jgi:hypothetical protein
VIYLYAIAGPLEHPLVGTGLDGTSLQSKTIGGLTAVYSSHDHPAVGSGPAEWELHEQVVEVLMDEAAVLPARFGTTFGELHSLEAAVSREVRSLKRRLRGVEGCVELAVRVVAESAGRNEPARGGRAYLLDKLSTKHRRQAVLDGTLASLRRLCTSSRLMPGSLSRGVMSISYLVPKSAVGLFSEQVKRLQSENPGLALSCTGPWPPYSFAGEEAA